MEATERTIDQMAENLLIMPEKQADDATQGDAAPEVDAPETAELDAVEDNSEAESTNEDEAPEEETEADAPPTFTVKVDGKEVAVTLDDLTRSYSGQAYIQKGMQEAASKRKAAEELFTALQLEQANFLAVANELQSQGLVPKPIAPSPELAKSDPIGYLQADAEYRANVEKYQDQQAKIQHVTQQQKALQEAAFAEYLENQRRVLSEKIPEYADPVKGRALQDQIRKVGGEVYGLTDQELGGITDARHVQILHDAMKWRELQSGKVQPRKAEPPKVLRPQAKMAQPPQLALKKQIESAKKSGKVDDFAAALLVRKQR